MLSVNFTRVRAIVRKEFREYRRNGPIVATMAAAPLGISVFPLLVVLALPASAAGSLPGDPLVILLSIAAIVPSAVAGYAVVGERVQGTLEPVLSTAIRREELLLAKATASLVPSLAVTYAVSALFVLCTKLFAKPAVAATVLRWPNLLAQLVFAPLIAVLSIWMCIAISSRSSDIRVAQQLGAVAGLPVVLVTYLITFGLITPTLGLVLAAAAVLVLVDVLGWLAVAAIFDRERLITSTG